MIARRQRVQRFTFYGLRSRVRRIVFDCDFCVFVAVVIASAIAVAFS